MEMKIIKIQHEYTTPTIVATEECNRKCLDISSADRAQSNKAGDASSNLACRFWGVVQAQPNSFASCFEKQGSIPLHSTWVI